MRRVQLLAVVISAALVIVAGGCGDDGDDGSTSAGSDQASSTTAGEAEATDSENSEPTVALRSTSLGDVLADADGMTLYLFTNDTAGKSNCDGSCAQLWPPLTADGDPVAGEGVGADKLGTITRSDGSSQVAYGGMPLYRYTNDTAVGDTTGQGVGGVWFVVGADAKAVTATASAAGTSY